MAIKFSQFVVQTDASTLSHVVGYNGVDNIQITPTNFLNSLLTGTAGQVLFYDTTGVTGDNAFYWNNTNKRLGIGITTPERKLHLHQGDSTLNYIQITNDTTGQGGGDGVSFGITSDEVAIWNNRENTDASISTNNTERIRITSTGNVGIGTNTPSEKLEVSGNIKVGDSEQFVAGTGADLKIYHDSSDSYLENSTSDLIISNTADDGDIIFKSDDGSGGIATYFQIDGSAEQTRFYKDTRHTDNIKANFGNGDDLQIYHDATDTWLDNFTGNLNIRNQQNSGDIIFRSDNGNGGIAEYFRVDGGDTNMVASKTILYLDTVKASFGNSEDLKILHNGTFSSIQNNTGDFKIINYADDKDIVFESDNGAGGTAEYFKLDGSRASGAYTYTTRPDGGVITFGDGLDLRLWHDPNTNKSYVRGYNNDLYIEAITADTDIAFRADDGSGGVATYFFLDGSTASGGSLYTQFPDNSNLTFGAGNDLRIYHNGTNSNIENFNGTLQFVQNLNDGDIKFLCDDGSGGVAEYFRVDGGEERNIFSKDTEHGDNISGYFGSGNNMRILYNGSHGFISQNVGGDLRIVQNVDDGDIKFQADDGSGGVTTYFQLDGSHSKMIAYKDIHFEDNIKARFGDYATADLEIYHDGNHSYIDGNNTGDLYIRSLNDDIVIQAADDVFIYTQGGENSIICKNNAAVELYHDNIKKLETTSTGINIQGVAEYANNTAALAGGLVVGDVYRTGDDLKIVH